MHPLTRYSEELAEQDLTFLGSSPYVYHCHHFNLFHDQTVEDALGEERAFTLRAWAAREAARHLLAGLAAAQGAATRAERLELAAAVFPWMGHGRLELAADARGGIARGEYLHYSWAWNEKYGQRVRRLHPIDAFAAGYAAAAVEVAFELPPGSLAAAEADCYACRQPGCRFELTSNGHRQPSPPVDRKVFGRHVAAPLRGLEEDRIAETARTLKDFVAAIGGDPRGLVQGFGIFITRHLAEYYDQTAYETVHHVEKTAPQSAGVVEELFGESGHVCIFYTCGNLLLSTEWEGLVGPVSNDVEETVVSCVAITRALGFGHWTITELVPGERLVLAASSNYEAPFYLERYGRSEKPRCYFFANAARAFMQLAERVDFSSRVELTEELYQSLFKSGLGWDVEETRCRARGDDHCEVVVTRRREGERP